MSPEVMKQWINWILNKRILCLHKNINTCAVNPSNNNTEPQCRSCGKWLRK